MTDQEIIREAYAETLKKVFAAFFQSSLDAKNDQERSQAEERFQSGVHAARNVRDKAFALLA